MEEPCIAPALEGRPPGQLRAGTPRRARILLAEDDSAMRRLLSLFLRESGYEVEEAADGEEAARLLDRSREIVPWGLGPQGLSEHSDFDLVIADFRMPKRTGLEVVAELRAHDRRTPVILISAFGDAELRYRATAAGVDGFIDKPMDVGAFRRILPRLLPPMME